MNRLITVIVLAIMIGVLMGCGSNPKSVEPQWSEVDAYTVSSELFNTTEDAEIPALREKRDSLNAEIAKIREDVLAMELKLSIGGPLNFKLTSSTTDQPETELMKKLAQIKKIENSISEFVTQREFKVRVEQLNLDNSYRVKVALSEDQELDARSVIYHAASHRLSFVIDLEEESGISTLVFTTPLPEDEAALDVSQDAFEGRLEKLVEDKQVAIGVFSMKRDVSKEETKEGEEASDEGTEPAQLQEDAPQEDAPAQE